MKAAVVTEQGVQYQDAPKPTPKAPRVAYHPAARPVTSPAAPLVMWRR